jgi:hypothetical protein
MARYYHGNMPKQFDKKAGGEIGGGIEVGPNSDYPDMLPRPPMFGGGMVPLKVGGLAFSLVGHGWWHIGPGEYVDLPDTVATAIIKNMAPQLLTKAEAVKAGIANEDGSLKASAPIVVSAPVAESELVINDEPEALPSVPEPVAPVRRGPGRPRH